MSERKPIVTHLLVSSLAAAALIGLWLGNPLESTAETVTEEPAIESPEQTATPVAIVVDTAPAMVALATAEEVATVETAEVPVAPQVTLVKVPDLNRLPAWEARKQLKKLGLGFRFKEGKRRVSHHDFDMYRVRKQSLAAGESVPAGTKVTMQVRERQFASGY